MELNTIHIVRIIFIDNLYMLEYLALSSWKTSG
jgi:hypothetical protein